MTQTTKTRRPRRMARDPQDMIAPGAVADSTTVAFDLTAIPPDRPTSPTRQTKASLVEGLLARESGATLAELGEATGWLPHTCRAFLTGLRKRGRIPGKDKRKDGTTTYVLPPHSTTPTGQVYGEAGEA